MMNVRSVINRTSKFHELGFFASPVFSERNKSSSPKTRSVKPFEAIPKPRSLPVIGHLHLFSIFGPYSFSKLYDAYAQLYKLHGPVVRLNLGVTIVLLFQPEDVKELFAVEGKYPQRPLFEALRRYRLKRPDKYSCAGLVAENGPEWHRLRLAVNFMMMPQFAHHFLEDQVKVAEDFVSRVRRERNSSGTIPDFLQELYRFTEEAIGVVCFGERLGVLDSQQTELSCRLTKASDDTMQALADTLLGFPWWKIFPTPTYRKLVASQDFFHEFSAKCVARARKLINDPLHEDDSNLKFLRRLLENEELKEEDLGLLMTEIFSGGIDATGNTIGFLLYCLAKRPEIQEKIFEEIKSHTRNGEPLDASTIDKMKYLNLCIKESYRLMPTSGGNARILSTPAVFSGYQVPEKVYCIGLNPVISRQEEHFEDPLDFRPERWSVRRSHPYCVVPFGHGTRRCVGQRFAEQEIRICVIKIVENFRIKYNGPDVGIKMRMLLVPDQPLNFTLIDR